MDHALIPYTTERRADTGVTNVTMGIWLFLASEAMLFAGLFSAYALLRVSAVEWPSGRELLGGGLALANTATLLLLTTRAWRAARGPAANVRRRLSGASILAAIFLVLQGTEWAGGVSRGLAPSSNMFLALYFTLTGLHALHVVGGLVANLWILKGSWSPEASRSPGASWSPGSLDPGLLTAGRAKAVALYWTFVALVWLVMFGLFYV